MQLVCGQNIAPLRAARMAKETTCFGVDSQAGVMVVMENAPGHHPAFFGLERDAVRSPERFR